MAKDAPIGVRLSPEARKALERTAQADDRSMSGLARLIIENWLREKGAMADMPDELNPAREFWLGRIQRFLEYRIEDAPDETCKTFARNLSNQTAEPLGDER